MEGNEQRLHPDVERFKQFMRKHPKLIAEMRRNNQSLQSLFEEWVILGEDHERWAPYREESNEQIELSPLVSILKQVDMNEVQNLLGQLSNVLASIQTIIQSFQRPDSERIHRDRDVPFSFRRD